MIGAWKSINKDDTPVKQKNQHFDNGVSQIGNLFIVLIVIILFL